MRIPSQPTSTIGDAKTPFAARIASTEKIGAKDRFSNNLTVNEWFLINPDTVGKDTEMLIKGTLNKAVFQK